MKDKFIYKDGLIYTNDKKNKKVEEFKTYKYQDNISDILATENVLEYLENNKNNILKNNTKILNKYIKTQERTMIFFAIIIFCLLLSIPFINLLNVIISILSILLCGGALYFLANRIEKNFDKKKNYNFGKLDKINEEININLKKLLELDMNQKKELEDNYKDKGVVKVNYKEKLIELRELIELYGHIASNKDKYQKYYDKGIIDKKLHKEYNEEERKLIKTYFDDKKN